MQRKMQQPTILVFNVHCYFNNKKCVFHMLFPVPFYKPRFTLVHLTWIMDAFNRYKEKGPTVGRSPILHHLYQVLSTTNHKTTLDRDGPEHTKSFSEKEIQDQRCQNSWKSVIPISLFYRKGNKSPEIFHLSKISLKTRTQII